MRKQASSMTNCHLISPTPPPRWFTFGKKGSGDAVVTLDRVLICPIDMFTKRQIKMAVKKYNATRGLKDSHER